MIRGLFAIVGGAMIGWAIAILTDRDLPFDPLSIVLFGMGALLAWLSVLLVLRSLR